MSTAQKWQVRLFFWCWFALCYLPMFYGGALNFLLLNTFLAYIPIEVSFQMHHNLIKNSWLFWLFLIVWLLFYPNAAYILTDLFHLSLLKPYDPSTGLLRASNTMWINFLMLLVSALVSAWVGFKTMFDVIHLLLNKLKIKWRPIFFIVTLIITVLNSVGIYIGRFLRIHTIYLFFSPRLFIRPLLDMWTTKMIIFTIIMTIIQLICYWLIGIKNKDDAN